MYLVFKGRAFSVFLHFFPMAPDSALFSGLIWYKSSLPLSQMMWIFAWDPWKPLSSRWICAPPSGSGGFCFYLPPEARDFNLEPGSKKLCHHSPSHLKLFLHKKKVQGNRWDFVLVPQHQSSLPAGLFYQEEFFPVSCLPFSLSSEPPVKVCGSECEICLCLRSLAILNWCANPDLAFKNSLNC